MPVYSNAQRVILCEEHVRRQINRQRWQFFYKYWCVHFGHAHVPQFFFKPPKPYTGKPTSFNNILVVHDKILGTKVFHETLLYDIHELLSDYFGCYARSISYPELVLPAVVAIKHFFKNARSSTASSKLKALLDVLQHQSKLVLAERNLINTGLRDLQRLKSFMSNTTSLTPLEHYVQQHRAQKKLNLERQLKNIEEQEKNSRWARKTEDEESDDAYDKPEVDKDQTSEMRDEEPEEDNPLDVEDRQLDKQSKRPKLSQKKKNTDTKANLKKSQKGKQPKAAAIHKDEDSNEDEGEDVVTDLVLPDFED